MGANLLVRLVCPYVLGDQLMAKWGMGGGLNILPVQRSASGVEEESAGAGKYDALRRVFDLALLQAAYGKGAERHANGQPFDRQPMMEISRMIGGPTGCFYQAMKKVQEASRMEPKAAKRELLGAINYLAGAYLLLEEKDQT
jgi:hypothetical protein